MNLNNKKIALIPFFILLIFIYSGTVKGELTTNWPLTEIDGTECYVYEVKKGESLYGLAKKYGWDLNELQKYNPELQGDLKKGDKIYYPASRNIYLRHEVEKGESIYSISKEYNIPLDTIYKYNPSALRGVKKGDIILLSQGPTSVTDSKIKNDSGVIISNLTVEEVLNNRPADYEDDIIILGEDDEVTVEEEISPEEPNIQQDIPQRLEEVRLAIVLDDPKSRKDIEFSRGALVALNRFKQSPYKINMKVVNGKTSSDTLLMALEEFNPNIVFVTADKEFPSYLNEFGESHHSEIVNIFYLKKNESDDKGAIIQMLPPSDYFNEMVASRIYNEYDNRPLKLVGSEDSQDGLSNDLIKLFGSNELITLENFANLNTGALKGKPIIYSLASKKDEITEFFTILDQLTLDNPDLDIILVGRSNWMAYMDDFKNEFEKYGVIIPSRVWLNTTTPEWGNFLRNYSILFGSTPMRSIPNFAASGYDMTTYFVPLTYNLNGDFSKEIEASEGNLLQSDIQLIKTGEMSGYQNAIAYLIKFLPDNRFEKIIVR